MFTNRNLALAALLIPALAIGSVYAAEPGFYIGASGGQTTIDIDAQDLYGDDVKTDTGYDETNNFSNDFIDDLNIDDDDTGWKAFVGYQFLPWLGVELGYVDFGGASKDLSRTLNFRGSDLSLDADVGVDLMGWDAFMIGTLPIGPVDLFAKVGAIALTTEVEAQVNIEYPGLQASTGGSDDEDDEQLAYGIGAAYNFGDGHWGLRVEAEGFDDNEVDDFYFLSAGITYRFFSGAVEPVAAEPVAAPAKCADGDGDGVCDDVDQCPNTPPGTRVGAIGCDCDFTLQLQFAFDSAKLTAADMAQLDKLVPVLNNAKAGFIGGVIEGHTDSIGSEAYNMGLSKRRAESVASYLQSQGVNLGSRFATEAFGEAKPIASNNSEAGRAENRRVIIRRTDCESSSE